MRLTQSFAELLTCGLSLMPIAARADVAVLFADYDGAQPKRGLAQESRRGWQVASYVAGGLRDILVRQVSAVCFCEPRG
jgi:hypothetical protein